MVCVGGPRADQAAEGARLASRYGKEAGPPHLPAAAILLLSGRRRGHDAELGPEVPTGASSNGAALLWWAPAPKLLLYGQALGQGKVPAAAAACREARFQVVPGVLRCRRRRRQRRLLPAAERGLPEVRPQVLRSAR
ncbi:hypothetical protein GQ55_3G474600 [Panicum hallii var. hallii]|uniref:Uncharacterized protein n=1 Tax=Panicum hallii var. hallii TaxID=1504633 RepID=A0A2T7EJE1_9POAL|nr:hypothetical protein GQ55_3G474600 [Panicum hallii var. hallii]